VRVIGGGAILPFPVNLPAANTVNNSDGDIVADLEHLEGMLVRFPQELMVSDLRNLERFGSVTLSEGSRLSQFTNRNAPDAAAYAAHKEANARRSIVLDDGDRASNLSTVRYLNAGVLPGYSIRGGDSITGITGNLRYSRGSGGDGDETWRLMPTNNPEFGALNPRPAAPSIGGTVRVASFNVLNFFSTVDSGQNACGPQGNDACRGADSSEELDRQLAKTVSALALVNADIVGLIELENNASESLQMIVDALNSRIGENDYAWLDTGTIHEDAIKTGFIYKTSAIALAGSFALLDRGIDSRFNDARNRPALAQSFEALSNGAQLTIIVNHLKSKGSSCEADGDPNTSDGQGNCNQTRTNAAAAIADWIATDPTGSNDPDFLIIGDLNAYTQEDPLTAFKNAGLTNLIESQGNPYSFVFDAQAGALDHAVATASLVPQVVQTIEWHINADEPALLDYNLEFGRDPALFDPDSPYRASDHDPVIIGLDLVN
jgi:predicted extracellular nuclease